MSNWLEEYKKELASDEGSRSRAVAIEGGSGTRGFGITSISEGLIDYLAGRGLQAEEMSDEDLFDSYVDYEFSRAKGDFEDAWPNMPVSLKKTVVDLYFNAGGTTGFPSFTRALMAGDYQEAAKQTLDIVSANDPKTGERGVLRGLANRRVRRYNEIADEEGFDRINDFSITPSNQEGKKTKITYVTDSGDISFDFRGALHSASGSYDDEVKKKSIEIINPEPDEDVISDSDYDDTPAVTPVDRAVERSDYVKLPVRTQIIDGRPVTAVEPLKPQAFDLGSYRPREETVQAPPPRPETVEAPPPRPETVEAPPPRPTTVEAPPPRPTTVEAPPPRPVTVEAPPPRPQILKPLDTDTSTQVTEDIVPERGGIANRARINPNNFDPRFFQRVEAKENTPFFKTVAAQLGYTYAPFINYLSNEVKYGPTYEIGYNPLNDMEGYEEYESALLFAKNPRHMADLKSEIDANIQRRRELANATFTTNFFAGMLDPINAIALPFAPTVSFARSALRTGVAVAGLQAGLEVARAPFDPLNTPEESAYNIGGAFVAGMALGGLVSIPLKVRSARINKTAKSLDEFQKVIEDADIDANIFAGPTVDRPFVNVFDDAINIRAKTLPKNIDRLQTTLANLASPEGRSGFISRVMEEKNVPELDAVRIYDATVRGKQEELDMHRTELGGINKEIATRKKEMARIEEVELKVPDPAGIAESVFTNSWIYKGITTPMKRFLQSKKLPTAVKLDMLRLAGDSGILLNMHKIGMHSGDSAYQAAETWNGAWSASFKKLQNLWAKDTDTSKAMFLDYSAGQLARGVQKKFSATDNTFETWLDNIGELYITNEKNLTDLQAQSIAEVRVFFKDWGERLEDVGLIGSRKQMQNRAMNLEFDIEVTLSRLDKAKTAQQREFLDARLTRQQDELEEINNNLETMSETRVLPANEEEMFPRFWNKKYIEDNRAELEQILFDWYTSNPFAYVRNERGVMERKRMPTDEEMVRGRAKKSVDEILGITDVTDDANAFYGYGRSKHFRHRAIDIPNKLVTDFIVKNPVKVMKAYTARVAPKYEFARKFGGRNIEEVLDDMTDRMYDSGMTTKDVFAARRDFRHMYDRTVGSVLREPDAMNQRVANVVRFAAETNYLGSGGFATIPDSAKIIMEHELGTITKTLLSLVDQPYLFKGEEGKLAGELLEIEMGSSHMRMVEDLLNNPLEQGILDKGRNIAYALNLLAPMTNIMKRIESAARGHTLIDYSIKLSQVPSKASKFEIEYLARYNIDKNMATEIANAPWEKTNAGLYLPNTQAWADSIQFPSTTANVMRMPTGKFKGNRYVPAFFRRGENTIYIDGDYIRNTMFPAKAWTKPQLEGVKPLDEDAFKTPAQFENFVMMHEIMHTKMTAGDLGIDLTKPGGRAAYENRINELALAEMKKQQGIKQETIQSFRASMNSGIMNTIIMGTPADKPIITDGVVYIPMTVIRKLGLEKTDKKPFGIAEDAQYTGYARVENSLIGLPFQFMSYSLGAANKITAAFAQNQIRNKTAGILASLVLGYAVLKIKTPDFVWDEMSYQDKFARSVDASGLISLYSDLFYESLAMSSALGTPDLSMGFLQPKYPENDPYAAVIGGIGGAGPSITYDLMQGAYQFTRGEYGEGAKQFVRNLPGMRLWFLRDQMNEMTRGWARY